MSMFFLFFSSCDKSRQEQWEKTVHCQQHLFRNCMAIETVDLVYSTVNHSLLFDLLVFFYSLLFLQRFKFAIENLFLNTKLLYLVWSLKVSFFSFHLSLTNLSLAESSLNSSINCSIVNGRQIDGLVSFFKCEQSKNILLNISLIRDCELVYFLSG